MGRTLMLQHDLLPSKGLRLLAATLATLLASGAWAAKPPAAKPAPGKPAPAAVTTPPRQDPAQRFLDKLVARGWYDLAVEFLEQAPRDPLVSESFKELCDFQRGATLFAGRNALANLSARQRQCAAAQAALAQFIQDHPQHERAVDARALLGSVLQERGRLARAESLLPTQTPEDQARLQAEARKHYAAAAKAVEEADRELAARDKQFPKIVGREDPQLLEARDAVRRQLLHVRLAAAGVRFDLAQTYAVGSTEARQELGAAAKAYNALYERYQPRLAAYYARLGEARCYLELGDAKKARTTLAECLEQPDAPAEFREMKTHATVVLLEALLSAKQYAALIEQAEAWLKQCPLSEQGSDDGLAISYLLGAAWLETARSLPAERAERAAALQNAQRLLAAASRTPGEYQAAAKGKLRDPLLAAMGSDAVPGKAAGPFDDARQRGQEALDRLVALQARKGVRKADLEAARSEARQHFQQALERSAQADARVPIDDVNAVRYYLAYLDYQSDRLSEAAELGEKLARQYPNSAAALPAAQIAMTAYGQLLAAPATADGAKLWEKMQALAQYLAQRWPGRPEVEEAWTLLARAAVGRQQEDRATKYLAQIPESSPRRSEAELTIGRALWSEYLQSGQLPDAQRPAAAARDALRNQARTLLISGIDRLQKAAPQGPAITANVLGAGLDLAQLSISQGQPAEAIKRLSDPALGPLALAAKGHPAADPSTLGVEAYRAALEAHLALAQFDAAAADLAGLERLLGSQSGAAGASRLAAFPTALGKRLQDDAEQLRQQKQLVPLAQLYRNYEQLAIQLAQDPAHGSFFSLACAAEIYLSLATALDESDQAESKKTAERYYQKVVQLAEQLLSRSTQDSQISQTPYSVMGIQVRQARALRGLRQYGAALDILAGLLKTRPAMVDVQVEAAETYQAWGAEQSVYYLRAIQGGREQTLSDGAKHNLVWGWTKISKLVQGQERFADVFYRARYNIPLCRVLYALDPANAGVRGEYLQEARRDLELLRALYPTLGGDPWRAKYDTLMRKIEALRGAAPKPPPGPSVSAPGTPTQSKHE